MFIKLIHVDAITKIPCNEAPMKNGPSVPVVQGLTRGFIEHIAHIECDDSGVYISPPILYGICDDDADINVAGVIGVLSDEEYSVAYQAEFEKRQPFPSWVGNYDTMEYNPPIPYPVDGHYYIWDEATLSWTLN
jgi:hypothetical protein